jgi:hypothetical protein
MRPPENQPPQVDSRTVPDSTSRPPRRWGGRRPGAGRPKGSRQSTAPLQGRSIYLVRRDWDYLATWDDTNPSEQLRRLIERARALWPLGPNSNPQTAQRLRISTPDQGGTP